MQRITKASELQETVINARNNGMSIGFIPTMGALHEGHLSLVRRAVAENNLVISSVFVNPTQFNESADFDRYPRNLDRDAEMLESAGCHILFAPSVDEVYPKKDDVVYDLGPVAEVLEGEHRPGHFNGVASVVKRLFELCRPHKAYFGLKDYQQYLVIKELVQRYNIPVEIVGCEIARAETGLALSSRNQLLKSEEAHLAAELHKSLSHVNNHVSDFSPKKLEALGRSQLHPAIDLEYYAIRRADNLSEPESDYTGDLIALVAARVGSVRLIDNLFLESTKTHKDS